MTQHEKCTYRRIQSRWVRAGLLLAFGISAGRVAADQPDGAKTPGRRAVLVGCTTYDNNPAANLKGSANDVALVRKVLVERFGFDKSKIRELTEGLGAELRPTRANILREIESLVEQVQPQDQVVVFLAGHGSQQPDDNNDEADGWDEIFLPADVDSFAHWKRDSPRLKGAIVDDEFRLLLQKLLKQQAKVLFIVDSCHSGSGIRGDLGAEKSREIPAPEEVQQLVPRTVTDSAPDTDDFGDGDWVALYAAQETEPTYELATGRDAAAGKDSAVYGLFTYTLCHILSQSAIPSYQELVQRVRGTYRSQGRHAPTPVLEGFNLNRPVLGGVQKPLTFLLERDPAAGWIIRAGQLHGLSRGSILAAYAPDDTAFKEPRAHLQIADAAITSAVVVPVAYHRPANRNASARDFPAVDPEQLRSGDLCVPVFLNLGDLQLPVAFDPETLRNDLAALEPTLKAIAEKASAPIRLVPVKEAQWFVTREAPGQGWRLSPRSRALLAAGPGANAADETGIRVEATEVDSLETDLHRVAKTHNLLRLASELPSQQDDDAGVAVDLEAVRFADQNAAPEPLSPARPLDVAAGEALKFRISTTARVPVYVTLLFVDSQYQMDVIFPRQEFADNKVTNDRPYESRRITVTAKTTGTERAILIATPSDAGPINYAFLALPTLAAATRDIDRSRSARGARTNLDALLLSAAFQTGQARGMDLTSDEPCSIRVVDWRVRVR